MVAVATQSQRVTSYTSFPRTGPHRSYSHESTHSQQPTPSPWFSCSNVNHNIPTPETDHPPSPTTVMAHRKRMYGNEGQQVPSSSDRKPFMHQQDSGRHHQQQQRRQQQPNYPTTIQFTPSQDDCDTRLTTPFDEDPPSCGLNRLTLEDAFCQSKSDDVFEKLYTGTEEDEGTFLSSSVELNPYTAKDFDGAPQTTQKTLISQNKNMLNGHQEVNRSIQQSQDSMFRAERNQPSPQNAPKSGPSTYEKKINEINEKMQLISPNVAMDRRHSSRPRARVQQAAVISPILRTGTGTSLRRNNTGTSSSASRPRNRSNSRGHRSRSRGASSRGGRRSRSRSTSIAPSKKGDDYHNNVFRGAALIREQLLRSMASADQAMDEAEREFMEEMIERGDRHQQLHVAPQATRHEDGDNGDIDFDYSFDHGHPGGTATARNAPSPSRSNCVRFAASQDSSALETESRRLDNLMHIFAASSSMSSSNGGHEMKRTSSDKENQVEARPSIDCQTAGENATHVISPTSSLGLSSPTSQLVSPIQNTKINNEYAGQYFQEDAPKLVDTQPSVEAAPIPAKNSNDHPEQVSRQKHQTGGVDEALAHAQRAGPLWRSLVGNHVRFPSKWDDMLPPTTPTIHSMRHKWSKWYYVARHRVKGDKRLNSREFGVRSRRSGGRILMRMIIREMHSQQVCREIAIGCFHPNSKGIRNGDPMPGAEDVREVWMAVRWVMEADENEPTLDLRHEDQDYEGVIDNFLMQKRNTLDYGTMGSALGHRKAVNNENVRAIFGDQSPMTTVDLHEDEVAEILKVNGAKKLAVLPALMLLKLLLFSK